LEGYDIHLFIKDINRDASAISIIPKSSEKYIAMMVKFTGLRLTIRFIDSFHFLNSSLDALVSNLKDNQFKFGLDKELRKKQFFPYEYIDSFERLSELDLPTIDKFYSMLKNENISEEDYKHAQQMFRQYNCKSLRDYHDLYLKVDVYLLAEVFENFR